MHFSAILIILTATFNVVFANFIDVNKVVPLAQPSPTTSAQRVAIKFKPRLAITDGCVSFPAVNSDGETNNGLKEGIGGSSGCTNAPLGSQVYGRTSWYNGKYAILYAWYFPKGFWNEYATRRHDWATAIVWIDSPDLASPSILGISVSTADWKYKNQAPATSGITNGTTLRLAHVLNVEKGYPYLTTTDTTGDFQNLIMWDQLPTAARMALNTTDFGAAKVPVSEINFEKKLQKAFPF